MKYTKHIIFLLSTLVISGIIGYITLSGEIVIPGSTYIISFLEYISVFILIFIAIKCANKNEIPFFIKLVFNIWFLILIFNLISGAFLSEGYWDWKILLLGSATYSFSSLVFFIGFDNTLAKYVFKLTIIYLFSLGFILIPLGLATNPELYARVMIPISLFILFLPFVKFKWKILILVVVLFSILIAPGFRSNFIKIGFSILLLFIYFFRSYISKGWLQFAHIMLFLVPIVLFTLGVTNQYNIFAETEKEDGVTLTDNNEEGQSLTQDTRTFLYFEVFISFRNTSEWWFGKSAIGSYISDFFIDEGGAVNGKRYGTEVGILNLVLQNGIIGVIFYFLLLFSVSAYAIRNSSNTLVEMMGLFIAFRWAYSFIEEYTNFDLNYFFFWIVMGLLVSKQFINMNNDEIKSFFKLE